MEFKEAIRLNPNSVSARIGFWEYLVDFGRFQEARQELARAGDLDPLSVRVSYNVAVGFWAERDFDRTREQLEKTISIDPHSVLAYDLLAAVFLDKKMPAEAFSALGKRNRLEGLFSEDEMAQMGSAYQAGGIPAYFRKENEFRQKRIAAGKYQSALRIALDYAYGGDDSAARRSDLFDKIRCLSVKSSSSAVVSAFFRVTSRRIFSSTSVRAENDFSKSYPNLWKRQQFWL